MSLPREIARCPGMRGEAWPFPRQDCLGCARRTEGIRDYMLGAAVAWMEPPKEAPCPERLEPKK
jgi:hypothetical protein